MKSIVKLGMYFLVIAMYSCKSKSNKEVADSALSHQSQISTSMSDKTAITKESPIYTNIIFPGFIIKLHNFGIFGGHGIDGIIDSSQVNIQQDKNKYWNLTAKSDTIGLQAYDFNNIIELVARNKTDRFKISYHFKALLVKNHGGQIIGTSNDRILKTL